jgi:hypothetical protein
MRRPMPGGAERQGPPGRRFFGWVSSRATRGTIWVSLAPLNARLQRAPLRAHTRTPPLPSYGGRNAQ